MGQDPYKFRRSFVRDDRMLAVLDTVAQAGNWGRSMPSGSAQGIAIHSEYKGRAACLVEIDCTPATVNRKVKDGFTGRRVTKVVYAVDVGLPINPLEFGVAASMAAVACAYARATGTLPTSFPINHNRPLGFTPYPTVPPLPESGHGLRSWQHVAHGETSARRVGPGGLATVARFLAHV